MSDLRIEHPHTLGLERARAIATAWAHKAQAKFGVNFTHEPGPDHDTLHLAGPSLNGQLTVHADRLVLHATLGFPLSALKGMVEQEIRRRLTDLTQDAAKPSDQGAQG